MDFGFGALIDKIEERIGRRATTALLWFASAAAFVLCINTIITSGIIPIVNFVRGVNVEPVRGLLVSVLSATAIGSISAGVFALIIRWLTARAVRRIIQRADERVQRAEEAIAGAEQFAAELTERLQQAVTLEEKAREIAEAIEEREMKGRGAPEK